MKIQQIRLSKMATFCYIIYDEKSTTCAVIDPAFDTDKILQIVKDEGYQVTHLINTHSHPDHSAGNSAVISKTGSKLVIHKYDAKKLGNLFNNAFSIFLGGKSSPRADMLVADGDTIMVGETKLTVLHTPGHTAGGICIYTEGHVITGDTLFVGGVGRTDLPGGSGAELLNSIKTKLYSLPPETIVWPGHDYGAAPTSTVGQEMRTNPFTKVVVRG